MSILKKCLPFIFACSFVFAQQTKEKRLDSLHKIIQNVENDIYKSDIYSELAITYSGIDSSKAVEYAQKALLLAQKENKLYNISKANFTFGGIYLDYDRPQDALRYYQKSKEQLEKLIATDSLDKYLRLWVRATFNIGVTYSRQGSLEQQIKHTQEITPLAEKLEFDSILGKANTNLGIAFLNLGQYEKSYQYFVKSEPYYKKTRDYNALIYDRLVFAACLQELDSLSAMKKVLDTTKTYLKKTPNALEWQMYYLINGKYHTAKKEYRKAIANYDQSQKRIIHNKTFGNLDQLYLSYYEAYKGLKDDKQAKKFLISYLERSKKNDQNLRTLDILKDLAAYETKEGNFEQANYYLNQHIKINDSIQTVEVLKKINQLEAQYRTEKKEREILELKNKNNSAELSLQKSKAQRYFLILVIGSLIFVIIIGYFVYRNRQRKTQINTQRYDQQIQKLKFQQESKVYAAILEGQEKERKRLAVDLHDGLAGRLSATSIQLKELAKSCETTNIIFDQVHVAAKNIDDSLSELRNIARHLMPETLFQYGLKAAVEDYCLSISDPKQNTKFILQFYESKIELKDTTLLTVYRIIQELINNAIKHANPNEVLIQYIIESEKISITIEDDGIGFIEDNVKTRGIGLNSVRTRVAYLNGSIEFYSTPNEGTNAHIEIPI